MGLSMSLMGEIFCHPSVPFFGVSGDLPLGVYALGAFGDLGGDIMWEFLGVPAGDDDGECLFLGGEFDLSIFLLCVSLLPLSPHLLPPSSACIFLLSSWAFCASF